MRKAKFLRDIKDGAVFIYPTDTVYGIGCDATNEKAVKRVRELKGRKVYPLSIIAPSKAWVLEHCVARPEDLERLPGPYTLIFQAKNHAVAQSVQMGRDTLGIRIPSHWISDVAEQLGRPLVTTSANITGGNVMQRLEDLPTELRHVDFIIYEGEHRGTQSTRIDLTGGSAPLVHQLKRLFFVRR